MDTTFTERSIADFDFDQVYKLKNDERFYFAFCDFAQETNFEEILVDYTSFFNMELLKHLEHIVRLPLSYVLNNDDAAGNYKFMIAKQEILELFDRETCNENHRKGRKRSNRKFHPGHKQFKGYQVLKNKDGNFLMR